MLLLALGMFLGALVLWLVPRLDWAWYEGRRARRMRRGEKMDETAWKELNTLVVKEMIAVIHYNLLASILRRLDKIEAATAYARPQWETPSSAGSLTTASRTKAALSAADSVPPTPPSLTDAITPMIPRSLHLLGAVMEAELIHADHCFECRDLQARLSSWLSMHVPVAGGIKTQEGTPSTSAKQAAQSSAGRLEVGHVKSPSSEFGMSETELPERFKVLVRDWLQSNQLQPGDVRYGAFPLGMVERWCQRAEEAEARLDAINEL